MAPHSPESVGAFLRDQQYIADAGTAMSVFLSLQLQKPLLVEGPAGVGKTEIAKVMAAALDTQLIRLQCYEGLDAAHALYEWNYQRQLLHIRVSESGERELAATEAELFSDTFLLKRPLLSAITCEDRAPVLLIDELDRADEEFESFLLEVLADWQITIPELGTIHAVHVPYVVLTSNRTRELSDAIRRRCLYLWLDYPDFDRELAIVRARVPGIDAALAATVCEFMQRLRRRDLHKKPGAAETCEWAAALCTMHRDALDAETVRQTLGLLIKDRDDLLQLDADAIAELLTTDARD
jgi:MoxR-like ATPase